MDLKVYCISRWTIAQQFNEDFFSIAMLFGYDNFYHIEHYVGI
jgi:hypothetical protein